MKTTVKADLHFPLTKSASDGVSAPPDASSAIGLRSTKALRSSTRRSYLTWSVFLIAIGVLLVNTNAQLRITYANIDDLIPYVNNAKQHSEAQINQIAGSIKEFKFCDPVGIDGENGIIEGHARVLAAQKIGLDKIPTIELSHLSQAQKKAYILAHNRLAEVGVSWDLELLSAELEHLQELEFDIELAGFDQDFILTTESGGLTDDEDVPAVEDTPVTQVGDIWELGNHRLICGDSTQSEVVSQLMGETLADVLVTDPPYNVDYEGKKKVRQKIKNDHLPDDVFRQFLTDSFHSAYGVMNPGAVFYIWHADKEALNFRQACLDVGFELKQCLIWEKDHFVLGRQDYQWKHEPCLYGWKPGGSYLWATDRKQTTILKFSKPVRSDLHPTMKPVDLVAYQIGNNTKKLDVVLDLFGGSGSTLIACEKIGRDARIAELDPKYCDVIVRRWQDYTGWQAVHAASGKNFNELEAKST